MSTSTDSVEALHTPDPVPPGFERVNRSSAFSELLGPLYQKPDTAGPVFAIRAQAKHCNARGQVHGGVLCSLADIAMGYSTALSTSPPTPIVTANLSIDYAGKSVQGDWIEVRTDVHKVGRTLAYANCFIHVGELRIARSSAVFSITPAERT
ncbi:PaaI family thioesterase [Dokdonella sp.]|uniref:PaaI family thioesterase n=1 Tax=Dokdonella sp. TaxID=2291710 RepID=UPI00352705B8